MCGHPSHKHLDSLAHCWSDFNVFTLPHSQSMKKAIILFSCLDFNILDFIISHFAPKQPTHLSTYPLFIFLAHIKIQCNYSLHESTQIRAFLSSFATFSPSWPQFYNNYFGTLLSRSIPHWSFLFTEMQCYTVSMAVQLILCERYDVIAYLHSQ